jgi:hypothetical protein
MQLNLSPCSIRRIWGYNFRASILNTILKEQDKSPEPQQLQLTGAPEQLQSALHKKVQARNLELV